MSIKLSDMKLAQRNILYIMIISLPMATIDTQFLKAEGCQVIRHPTITFVKKQLFVMIGHLIISWVIQHCSIVCRESWDLLGTSTGFTVFPDDRERLPTFIYSWNFIVSCVYCCICISGWKARWKTTILWHWIYNAGELV